MQRGSRLEIELEDKGPYRGVCEYMSGGEMDELRRTSRTVCLRLVTPLPTPSVKERGVLWGEPKKRRIDSGKLSAAV